VFALVGNGGRPALLKLELRRREGSDGGGGAGLFRSDDREDLTGGGGGAGIFRSDDREDLTGGGGGCGGGGGGVETE
jgi:hypothetical protein